MFGQLIYCGYGPSGLEASMRWRVGAYHSGTGLVSEVAGPTVGMTEWPAGSGNYWARVANWDEDWDNPVAVVDDQSGRLGSYFIASVVGLANIVRLDGSPLLPALVAAGEATVVVVNNVQVGALVLVRGDSHLNADGNPLRRAKAPGAPWPTDLTGWTITFTARKAADIDAAGSATITAAGTIVTPTGDSQEVRFDLPAVDTAGLAIATHGYEYDVQASKGASRVTLETGTLSVVADQTTT